MATADPNNMQLLYRRLKQEFPDIPESVILSCINRYPNDLPTCIAILNQQRSAYQYAPINKQDKDHFNHYETTRPYPIVHGPVQMQQQQQPYRYTGQKSYPGDPIPSDYNPIRRNTLTPATANRGYHRPANQPQSAPVVPNMYQPFHAEYPAKLSPRAGSHHPQQPPTYSVNDYMNQYDQYKYEVALNYNQGTCGTYSLSSSSSIQHQQSPHKVQAYVNACAAPLESSSIELRAPFEPARHVTSLNINPVGPHMGLYRFEPRYMVVPTMSPPSQQPPVMHSTTINMRLQPPSSYPQPRVQINTTGGGNVVYSASPGLTPTKSHFHITFNRATGSNRTRQNKQATTPRQCSTTTSSSFSPSAASLPVTAAAASTTCLSFRTCSSSTTSCSVMSGSVTVSSSVLQQRKSSETTVVNENENFVNNNVDKSNSNQLPLDIKDANKKLSQQDEKCNSDMTYVKALVVHQRAQMDRLQQKLNEDRLKLDVIRQQVSHMELELYNRIKALKHPAIFNPDDMKKLREETRKLRVECDCMSREVDFLVKGQVPLGETSEDFYKHINPGQSGSIGTPPSSSGSMNRRPSASPIISNRRQEQEEEGRQWGCSQCTFLNNPALDKCEMCEMPRLSIAADFG